MPPPSAAARVYAADGMTGEALAALIEDLLGAEPPAIVRRIDCIRFFVFSPELPERWSEGQTFGPKAEIRWRREEAGFAVLLLCEAGDDPPEGLAELPGPALVADGESKVGHSTLLWGTHSGAQTGGYRETRISGPLHYPGATGPKPPRLVHRLYREAASGAVRWMRLVRLAEDREEKSNTAA